ncbi:tRNA threonylcarbamoyladenosine dehydratase [Allisonella histaminiformans]|uniref:tRNA threonylcarbamoyladenosine dehydratase n=1 Tax=Allisonella histaminiformans TaxID=209880 RepID=UPI002E791570|nr:tRNA threonylcarbamoyladenosine dehydratase [Allisonella histaminiformans]
MDLLFQRTARIIGEDGVNALKAATVAVFGTGGVGSYACEALGRAGVGHLIFIDKDVVDETNMNRQLVADLTTLGRNKVEVMAERVKRVNPSCDVQALVKRYDPSDDEFIPSLHADFVIDAIDDVPAKVAMAICCWKHKIPEISSMGTGNRLHPEMLEIVDIYKTRECHLARKMRKALKEARVRHLPVVYSWEPAHKIIGEGYRPGSISFVPPVSGMMMAGYVIREILKKKGIQ